MNASITIFSRALAGTMLTVTTSAWASPPVALEAANTTDGFAVVDGGVRRGVVVVNKLEGQATTSSLPGGVAWAAILIDYLEIPVIYDTMRRVVVQLRQERSLAAFAVLREDSR